MKTVKLIAVFLCTIPYYYSIGQVTEAEKTLKTQSVDTTKGWKRGGLIGINFGQTSLTNWAAGGQNSLAANGILSLFASYKKDKNAWDNSLDIGYGILNQEGVKYTKKTDDKIDLLSKYGREAFKNFYYAALINFKTQMDVGYNYPTDSTRIKISNKFAPAYVVIALGIDYKPNAYFSIFAAPFTGKLTIVNDQSLADAGAFGVDKGENTKSEFGGYVRMIYSKNDFKGDFLKNVAFTTKVDLFSNYTKDPQNVVVNWETLIALKINKYISVNLSTQLIYDDKIKIADKKNVSKPRVQFKEILGVGFSYKF
ncbi:MAG: DUF3078 domain-containing protein [Bacteroidales bacterium]|nr:DUF3078 domain-containing protein [Bacteroidales bacterium]